MAIKTLGKVTATAGTPVRLTNTQSVPATRIGAQAVFIQAWPTNTGKVYVGNSALVKASGAGMFGIIPAPASGSIPFYQAEVALSPAGLNLADIYIDVETSSEGVIISYTEQ